jgi:hypothetical protein
MKLPALTTLLLTAACAGPVLADDAPTGLRQLLRWWDCPRVCGSCDDYCRKPCPALMPVLRCGSPDDYCRKAAPCLMDVPRCGSVDDYCRKSMPHLLCPLVSSYPNCDPTAKCCVPTKRP